MQKKKGQEYEVCEYIYLCGLVTHASFEKSVGMITEYSVEEGTYSVTLIGKSKNFHLDGVQIENMRLIMDDATWQERYKEDPLLLEDIAQIEKQERMAPVVEHGRRRWRTRTFRTRASEKRRSAILAL